MLPVNRDAMTPSPAGPPTPANCIAKLSSPNAAPSAIIRFLGHGTLLGEGLVPGRASDGMGVKKPACAGSFLKMVKRALGVQGYSASKLRALQVAYSRAT